MADWRPPALAILASCALACQSTGGAVPSDQLGSFSPALGIDLASMVASDGIQYRDIAVGAGTEARPGNIVSVYYMGWLADGTPFDSTRPPEPPIRFTVGDRQVIAGWERGVTGMRVGGRRQLVIPPSLGYGNRRVGPVPPRSTLVFTVELVEVR